MSEQGKGLVIIYDPHSLQQFIWYYFTYGTGKKWDALCLPNGYKGTYMEPYCRKTGLFDTIIKDDTEYMSLGLFRKFKLICKMTGYYIVGKRKLCAKRILNEYVGSIDDYDEVVALCDIGFISGLCALLGDEKTISYLDDGLGDYNYRDKWSNTYKKTSLMYWQGFVMSRMGYGCAGRFYFKPTEKCIKYCAVPEEMKYRNYKEIRSFDMSNTDVDGYNNTLRRTYVGLSDIDFDSVDAVFFTDNLEVFSPNYQDYYDKCSRIIGGKHRTVLLKKHPRDGATYSFPDGVRVIEVDNEIPAEIILPYLKGKQIYFSIFSSIIIFMQQYNYSYSILYSSQMYQDNISNPKSTWHFHSKERVLDLCRRFSTNEYNIIETDGFVLE